MPEYTPLLNWTQKKTSDAANTMMTATKTTSDSLTVVYSGIKSQKDALQSYLKTMKQAAYKR